MLRSRPVILFFILAALAPLVIAYGVVLWGALVHRNPEAGGLARAVGIGIVAGAVMGLTVTGLLILLVLAIVRLRGH